MRESTTTTTAPTRIIVLDLLSLVLLAAAAGLACGIALAGATLLFASRSAEASAAQPGAAPVIERPLDAPLREPRLPESPAAKPARTVV